MDMAHQDEEEMEFDEIDGFSPLNWITLQNDDQEFKMTSRHDSIFT